MIQQMTRPEILIIAVTYNTYPETLRFLESIALQDVSGIHLILVDNGNPESAKDFPERIKQYPFTEWLISGTNSGYFGGARYGLAHYLDKFEELPPWILVTNVDIEFDPAFFGRLKEIMPGEHTGIIAPAIYSERWKRDCNPEIDHRYSRRRMLFYRLLYASVMLHNIYLAGAYIKRWIAGRFSFTGQLQPSGTAEPRKIYAPHGSCLVFCRNYFACGGTLNMPNFLFGEEIFVGETASRLGLVVLHDRSLVVRDAEHASIGSFVTRQTNHFYRESIDTALKLFYS